MSRYTPKRLPAAAGGGRARPTTVKRSKAAAPKKAKKKSPGTGAFACTVCDKRFNTEEALATHALDAHAKPIDVKAFSAKLAPNMTRCPLCAAPLRKRNLDAHMRMIHAAGQDEGVI